MFNKKLIEITEKIINLREAISYEEACELARLPGSETIIYCFVPKIKEKFKNSSTVLCSIINAKSGFCSENCAFCAQSSHHKIGNQNI